MEIKKLIKLIILTLTAGYLSAVAPQKEALQSLFNELTNLEVKFEEFDKIKEADYKKFYRDLRLAIRSSLQDRKLDMLQFNELEENAAKRTAQYVLERLFEQNATGSVYKFTTKYEQPAEGSTVQKEILSDFEYDYPNYKPIKAPFENIVDQIVLIARLVDYILTNYKDDENVSILSIDVFDSIFYVFFAMAFENEKLKLLNPGTTKLNLTILSDILDQDDFNQIKQTLEKLGNIINIDKVENITVNQYKSDIFLVPTKMKLIKQPINQLRYFNSLDKNNLKTISFLRFMQKHFFAFVTNNVPGEERESIFNQFIKEQLKIDIESLPAADIAEYKTKTGSNPLEDYVRIILNARNLNKNNSQIFMLNSAKSQILDFAIPTTMPGSTIFFALVLMFAPDIQVFVFNPDSKQFIRYTIPQASRIKIRQL